jgi:hypothetical protein
MIGDQMGRFRVFSVLWLVLFANVLVAETDERAAGREIVSIYLGAAGLSDDPV